MSFDLPGFPHLVGSRVNERIETPLADARREMPGERLGFIAEKLCEDPDFSAAFVLAIPDKEEQKKYLLNTSRYELGTGDHDPRYTLFFRRTLPSDSPKHEERWTNEYMRVLSGLRQEIPFGPHRLHSVILCDSLAHLETNGRKPGDDAFTDGEIIVNFPEYQHKHAICSFKPAREIAALEEYLRTEGAISAQEILCEVQESKR